VKTFYGNEDSSLLGRSALSTGQKWRFMLLLHLEAKQSKAVLFMGVFNEAIQTHTHEVYTWRVKSPCAPVGSRI
jgi:hypothetical protein